MMQDYVGIVRIEHEMLAAMECLSRLWKRAKQAGAMGNREYNPGWHTALDLNNLLTVSEAITRSAMERKESRGAQFREDYPKPDATFGKVNLITRKGPDGSMQIRREPLPEMPPELKQIIEEMK
jgi:succinate dehydrogenase flavoprotein subunit